MPSTSTRCTRIKSLTGGALEKEGSNRAKRTFDTKEDALKNLRDAVGPHGGSVRIRKVDNTIQEERTYPRSKDPKRSPG